MSRILRASGSWPAAGLILVPMLAVACAAGADGQKQAWQSVGLCGGGGLFNPVASPHDPEVMMVESDMGGRYISRDGGRTWTMIHHRQIGAACRGATPLFHPTRAGTIYALSGFQADAIHVSTDNGATWKRWPDGRQPKAGIIGRFFVDRARPGRLFLAGQAALVFTDDEGQTWRKAEGAPGGVYRFVVDRATPPQKRVMFVGGGRSVYRSDDGGESFAKATGGLPEGRPVGGFAGGSDGKVTILYAAVPCRLEDGKLAGGMYVSKDGARSWQRVMNPKIDVSTQRASQWARGDLPQYSHTVANDADPGRAYVYCGGTSYFPPNHSTIYRTDDAGASWQPVFFVDPRFKECNVGRDWMTSYMRQSWVGGPIDMEISPTDPDTMMRSDGMFLFITNDAGKTWFPGHAVKADPKAERDRDVVWKHNGLVNTTTWHYYVDPHQPRRHYVAYTDIGFARSMDGGATWRWWGPAGGPGQAEETETEDFPIPRAWINTCYELAFDPQVPGTLWGVFSGHHDIPNENSIWRGTGKSRSNGGVCVSKDFGVTWQALRTGLPDKPALSIVVDPNSPKGRRTLYAGIYDHGVYKSTDGGQSWALKSKGLGDLANMRICQVLLHRDGTLLALITGMRVPANGPLTEKGVGLYRSADGAESWQLVNKGYPLLYPKGFGVDPNDSRVIFIGACDAPANQDVPQRGGLHRSTDGGKTWKRVLRKRKTHFGAYFHPQRKGWVYATCCGWSDAPEGSLFLSTNGGETWRPFAHLPFAQVNRIDFDPNDPDVIYASTFGGSIWKGPAQP